MRRWDGPMTAQALSGVFVALTMILVLAMAPLSLVVAGRAEAAGLTMRVEGSREEGGRVISDVILGAR